LRCGRRENENMSDQGYDHGGPDQVPHNKALEATGMDALGLSLGRLAVTSRWLPVPQLLRYA
jgi:hypothetical protein